jgi:hypothetical protein
MFTSHSRGGQTFRQRILVVDDEVSVAPDLIAIVQGLGYECVGPVHDARSALAIIIVGRLDAAILSLSYGGALFSNLTDALVNKEIPFGFANGFYEKPLDGRWAKQPYLGKPYSRGSVSRLLLALLSDRE